jgi:pilus assembly protein Flp/PilA
VSLRLGRVTLEGRVLGIVLAVSYPAGPTVFLFEEGVMKELFKSYWADESGQGLTEYGLIVGIVAVALLLILIAFRDQLARIYRAIVAALTGADPVILPAT